MIGPLVAEIFKFKNVDRQTDDGSNGILGGGEGGGGGGGVRVGGVRVDWNEELKFL